MSRELDIAIATRVMGLMHDAEGKIFKPAGMLYHWHIPNVPACDLPSEHRYSDDLNTCRLAELRLIEMGLGEKYAVELWMTACLTARENEEGWLMLLTAPAEARCRAMLSVLEGV